LPEELVAEAVRSSWAIILSNLFPKALITHVTALTYQPNKDGEIFITSTANRELKFPGLTIKVMRGHPVDSDDVNFMNLKASSFERALLENLSSSRGGLTGRTTNREDLEKRLEAVLLRKGEMELNKIRDCAREVSKRLNMDIEFRRLEKIIGALLGTKPNKDLNSDIAIARSNSLPYDPNCFWRLEILFGKLRHEPLEERKEIKGASHFNNKAFFESYFSNYIEGTIFELAEAE
jgi:hypothetical protein